MHFSFCKGSYPKFTIGSFYMLFVYVYMVSSSYLVPIIITCKVPFNRIWIGCTCLHHHRPPVWSHMIMNVVYRNWWLYGINIQSFFSKGALPPSTSTKGPLNPDLPTLLVCFPPLENSGSCSWSCMYVYCLLHSIGIIATMM